MLSKTYGKSRLLSGSGMVNLSPPHCLTESDSCAPAKKNAVEKNACGVEGNSVKIASLEKPDHVGNKYKEMSSVP